MSTIVSPKTGRLIKVGSKSYEELIRDPKYKDMMLNPSSHKRVPEGKVSPSAPKHSRPLRNLSNLPSVPKPSTPPKMALPPLAQPPRLGTNLPPLPRSPIYSPSSPSVSLENIPMPEVTSPSPLRISMNGTPTSLSTLKIPVKQASLVMPPAPSPKRSPPSLPNVRSSLKVPVVPSLSAVPKLPSPTNVSVPKMPTSIPKIPTSPLPVPKIPASPSPLPVPKIPASIPKIPASPLPLPKVSSLPSPPSPLLPLPPKLPSPKIPLPIPSLPTSPSLAIPPKVASSPSLVPLHQVYDITDEEMEDILSMPFFDIPSLEEVLKSTTQPARRAKIQAMIDSKKAEEGRGMKTRGWSARSPTKGKERHQLHKECGDKCFLLPESEKFPICSSPRTTGGKSVCEVDCQGAQAAKIRAAQWKYPEVERKADKILEKCNREGDRHFRPSSPVRVSSPKRSPSARMAGRMDQKSTKEELMMPRRVARRTARRTSVAMYDHHDRDHRNREGDRHRNIDRERDMDRDRYREREGDRILYDHRERENDRHRNMDRERERERERDRIVLSPSMARLGSDKERRNMYERYERDREMEKYKERRDREKYMYEKEREKNMIKLSPSMSRLGSDQKKAVKVEEDCGCGK